MTAPRQYSRRVLAQTVLALGLSGTILGAAPLAAQDKTRVQITHENCARLAVYSKPDGVDYQPGRDVRGRPVVPADLSGGVKIKVPRVIEFDLDINPVEFPNTEGPSSFDNTRYTIGRVTYDRRTGLLLFNGQPLTDPLAAELSKKCQQLQAASD